MNAFYAIFGSCRRAGGSKQTCYKKTTSYLARGGRKKAASPKRRKGRAARGGKCKYGALARPVRTSSGRMRHCKSKPGGTAVRSLSPEERFIRRHYG